MGSWLQPKKQSQPRPVVPRRSVQARQEVYELQQGVCLGSGSLELLLPQVPAHPVRTPGEVASRSRDENDQSQALVLAFN